MADQTKEWGGVIISPCCKNNCFFCKPKKNIDKSSLDREKINVFRNLIDFKKQGIKKIEISGCDPIEYEHILELVDYIRKLGFSEIQLSTHGRDFSDKELVKKIELAGLTKVRIPLYSSESEMHDMTTGAKGSFEEAVRGIRNLSKTKIKIQVSALITNKNKNDLTRIADLVKDMGVTDFYISVPLLSLGESKLFFVPLKDLKPYLKKIYNYSKKTGYDMQFFEIPYCAFGFYDESINNKTYPPNLGRYCQPVKIHKTNIKDMPAYRVKIKSKICKKCFCDNVCDGFLKRDIEKFGIGDLKPVQNNHKNSD
jgi:MoaA/NifB/PqqE/SkfB family radical SAM enzyme